MNEIYANDYRDLGHLVERMEEFIERYCNRRRLHSAPGYRTPEESSGLDSLDFLRSGETDLDRLKPDEAATIFRRLLKAHPDLSSEADEIGRSLLRQLEYEDVAAEIEDEIRALDYEDLNARAGGHEWGYVEPSEAAWEILEEIVEPILDDMKRHIEVGLEAEALEICKGMVLGLYRLSEREGGDVLGWASDFPAEAARNSLEIWYAGSDNPKSRDISRKTRPPLPQDFLSMVPKGIPMIEGILKETT